MRLSFVKFTSPLKLSFVLSGMICFFFFVCFLIIFSFVRTENKQLIHSLTQSIVQTQRLQIQSGHFRGLTEILNQDFSDMYLMARDLKSQTLFEFNTKKFISTCENTYNDTLKLNLYICKPFKSIVPAFFSLCLGSILFFLAFAIFVLHVEKYSKQSLLLFLKETGLKLKSTLSFRDILSEHKNRLQLVSHLAHDLRSPLLVFQESLRLQKLEEWERYKPRMSASMSRVQSMINSLNDASLDELCPIHFSVFHLNAVLEEAHLYAKKRNIEFITETETISCFLDKEKIERAVSNLLHNAIKFAKSRVKFCMFLKDRVLILHVMDDGPGVPTELDDLIYTEHFHFGREGGTGLGLSYAKRIVTAHHGSLTHICKDHETVFEIRIPQ